MPDHKYKLTICAIVKNEQPYLLEWIAFHRCIGVEHFLIFDNESTDGCYQLLRGLEDIGLVTIVRWPSRLRYPGYETQQVGPQVPAYNFALKLAQSIQLSKWMAFIDLDEFIVPAEGSFLELLDQFDDFAGIAMNWKIFGSAGHKTRTDDLVIERFRQCSELPFVANRHVKSCVQTDKIKRANIHICYPQDGAIVRTNLQEINYDKDGLEDVVLDDRVVINHYFVKSYEEWQAKRVRGRPSRPVEDEQRIRNDRMFTEYDRNETTDQRILRFVTATRAEVERLKTYIRDS